VVRSVVGPGVVVEQGAEVHDSILLHDSYVGAGAQVTRAILDSEAHVEENATVGDATEIAVVEAGARITA
jgi:glucose-1-phosphate adenylyltransferase